MAFKTSLIKKEMVADQTLSIHLEKPDRFSFRPGQNVDLAIEDMRDMDTLGSVRTMSIVSAPHEPVLTLAMRMSDSAFKRELSALEEGADRLSLDGPFGNMILQTSTDRPAIMIAGGIGVTPFMSMIRHARHNDLPHTITLFYSCRAPTEAAYLDELNARARDSERFSLVSTMTRLSQEDDWSGTTDRIDQKLLEAGIGDTPPPIYYIAGSPDMVKAMWVMLEEMGVSDDDIRTEEFTGY